VRAAVAGAVAGLIVWGAASYSLQDCRGFRPMLTPAGSRGRFRGPAGTSLTTTELPLQGRGRWFEPSSAHVETHLIKYRAV
jgi:hypothetical protein